MGPRRAEVKEIKASTLNIESICIDNLVKNKTLMRVDALIITKEMYLSVDGLQQEIPTQRNIQVSGLMTKMLVEHADILSYKITQFYCDATFQLVV